MATDWRDIIRRGGEAPAFDAPPAAPPQTPEMARLLAERAALEARMTALSGGGDANSARYPVTPLAQRRADHRRWEDRREQDRRKPAAERPASPRPPVPATPAVPALQPQPGGTPVDPRRWYARRDAAVTNPAPKPAARPARNAAIPIPPTALAPRHRSAPRATTAPPTLATRAKADLTPVRPVKALKSIATPRNKPARQPVDPLAIRDAARASTPRKPESTARPRAPLAETRPRPPAKAFPVPRPAPAREPARPFGSDLRRAIQSGLERPMTRKSLEKIGADRIAKPREKIQKPLEKARTALDSANRAIRTLSDAWDKRRDRIAGPDLDRYTQGYDANKTRLLGVETGSLNDMAERSERQREAGIARRAEARRVEAADENRRTRAKQNRLEQRKAER